MSSQSQFYVQTRVPSTLARWWRHYKNNSLALIALLVLVLITLTAIFADIIAPYDPSRQFSEAIHLRPSWYLEGSISHLLGTDSIGRDLFSRLVHGARLSLFLAFVVVLLSSTTGIFLGVVASFSNDWVDSLVMRIMDFIRAVPSLILAVVIVAIIGPGLPNAIYAVAFVLIPHFVVTTRSAIKEEKSKNYVTAMLLDGASRTRLFFRSILPNILAPIIVQITLAFSIAILEISTLGFLGLGAQAPDPEWGTILSESHHNIMFAPWTVTIPGLAILFTLLSINLVGDGMKDAMEMRKK